ncbi:hypothetical protein CH330_01200 [candidate division WOR-3 bacterium JGI_Cruoil_03_51_56]|uniref:FlgD/Vpr Ig-like domain-containing protein n=1 Tax=candidate division WOR-3 bacterium JGI_Cruoil_03_51_56 TaxID=1973747 RepID=A0A235BXA6_UNCW3|nr:MAG: hypothetical protein CH330_01200 [candidate division WOR-3 bacterium JGI_Cruoil_03_51_56]
MRLLLVFLLTADAPTTLLVPPFSHTLGFHRVGRFYLELYLGKDFKIADPEGMCGAKMIEEDDPSTSRDDHILTLFAVNSGTGQVIYNVKLVKPGIFPSPGSDSCQFDRPHGICCNPKGDVYIADTGNNRIVRLRYTQGRLHWVSVLDSCLKAPSDVDLDSRGRVYVADTDNNRIVIYNPNGTIYAVWTPGLERPTAIAVLDQNADYNEYGINSAVVIDRNQTRIEQLSLSGQIRRQVGMRRIGFDEAAFSYCAFDRHGNVYVTDRTNSEIHIFDPNLKYLVSYGKPGEFNSPRGIVIWRRFGQLFVNETEGGQYYWIGLDAYFIGCYPPEFNSGRPGTTIAFYITETATVTVIITNNSGTKVRTLTPPHAQRPGEVLIVWDGKDNDGNLVKEGNYRISITVKPTYSKQKYIFKKELVGRVRRVPDI